MLAGWLGTGYLECQAELEMCQTDLKWGGFVAQEGSTGQTA